LNAGRAKKYLKWTKTSVRASCLVENRGEQIRVKEHFCRRFGAGDVKTLDEEHVAATPEIRNENYQRVSFV
jgi:hypothetical protein